MRYFWEHKGFMMKHKILIPLHVERYGDIYKVKAMNVEQRVVSNYYISLDELPMLYPYD